MNRLTTYIQVALLFSVVALLVRVWPLTIQANTRQPSAEAAMNGPGKAQLSQDTEAVLVDIARTLADESKWPRTRADIEKLQERLKGAVDILTPDAQEQALPRLVPRRWEIQALWLLATEN